MEICQLPDVPLFRGLTEAEAETAITALWMRRKAFAKGEILLEAGIDMVITNGQHPEYLAEICAGVPHGTLFTAHNAQEGRT